MSNNMVSTTEELINKFMKEFYSEFDNLEATALHKIYKVQMVEEFATFSKKIIKDSEKGCKVSIVDDDNNIPRPPQVVFISYFLAFFSGHVIRKNLRKFLENNSQVSAARNRHHVNWKKNYSE
ncbi:hypothetical protein RhiirA4_471464 [Rhizophagus irregularis]|uniref:Uncharacterized protein n=1 Tax=Rhizophagus irregularis TaxID=588596 RepID=A0A2I1H371_9GLOM|nr:hypothetical protein RhiirA4_471464 [Rhizophagus irregularis]